jgi:hypothetical protein
MGAITWDQVLIAASIAGITYLVLRLLTLYVPDGLPRDLPLTRRQGNLSNPSPSLAMRTNSA